MKKNIAIKNKSLLWIILIVVIIFALIVVLVNSAKSRVSGHINLAQIKIDGTVLPYPQVIEPFRLTDNHDRSFTKQKLLHHWTFMFFGYTNCAYVCPVTMAEFHKLYNNLHAQLPDRLLPQVVFISVDPQRDTIEKLNQYVKSFNPHFIGLRGSIAEVQALARQMNVSFHKIGDGDNYVMAHTATVMLLNPEGNLVAYFSYPHKAVQMARDYEKVIRAYG